MRRGSLHRRLLLGMLGYLALLSVALVIHGQYVNEAAERVVLRNLLDVEMDRAVERLQGNGRGAPARPGHMRLYDGAAAPLPRGLQGLAPGLHDDLELDGREYVVLVRDALGRRLALSLDIGDFEHEEVRLARNVAASSLALVALFALALAWSIRRLLRPLDALAEDIKALRPEQAGRLHAAGSATRELHVIAEAFNSYLDRQARYVERERDFVNTASHELRTPMAVISQATELVLGSEALAPRDRHQLERIAATVAQIGDLITLLLVLARDPGRIADLASDFDMAVVLAAVVEDHRHLLDGRELVLKANLPASLACRLPEVVLRAVAGNLLRNAIEHSGRGTIMVRIEGPSTLVIEDPGQRMTASEVSARYAQALHDPAAVTRTGVGLALIARLCEHMGWVLEFENVPGGGMQTRLGIPCLGETNR